MSQSDDEINRREVAYRLFAAEFDDADYSYAESDEERAPNYVVTPTGARVNRVFVVGVLTEVEQVNDDVVRARIVDPTGAFVVYAGQYQPEALAALEAAETPSFVAVTGKARTFQPEDSNVVYTSVRPEEVSEVDAETRDRWTVTTAEQTVDRVATMAAARDRVERGDDLRSVLEASDVSNGLAAGIPLALDHYDTSPAYLQAVYDLALDAARVVAGDADEVEALSLAPSQGGDADLEFAATLDADVEVGAGEREAVAAAESGDEATPNEATVDEGDAGDEAEAVDATEAADAEATAEAETGELDAEPSESGAGEDDAEEGETAESDAEEGKPTEASGGEAAEVAGEAAGAETTGEADDEEPATEEAADDGEMYELSEEEREEVKENYDVDFSSGSDIPDAGETDIDAPEPDEEPEPAAEPGDAEAADDATADADTDEADEDLGDFDDGDDDEADDLDDFTEDEYDEPASDAEDAEAGQMDLDLEDAVVDLMDELDDGDGARREEVVAEAADRFDADEGEIEDAIEDALMGGRCYESGDDHLKAI